MKFLSVILLFISFVSYSQKINIKISADKTIVEEEFPVSIKFETDAAGNLNIDLSDSFVKLNSSNGSNQTYDRETRKPVVYYYLIQQGYFNKAGTYKIRAVYEVAGKKYKSNTIKIKVVKKTATKKLNLKVEYA